MARIPDKPYESPANWTGASMQDPNKWVYRLTENEINEVPFREVKGAAKGIATKDTIQLTHINK